MILIPVNGIFSFGEAIVYLSKLLDQKAFCVTVLVIASVSKVSAQETPPSQKTRSAITKQQPTERITVRGQSERYVANKGTTATKTDTALIQTPQSVVEITSAQIRDQNAQTLGAILRYAPGVQGELWGGTDLRFDTFVLRGFPVSMPYMDGLNTLSRYTLLSPSIQAYGVDRADVLLGPSSVLYGQNAPGGLVNVTSKRPTDTPLHEVIAEAGNYGHARGAFDLGGPLALNGKVTYRLTGEIIDSGTQVDHVHDSRYYIAPSLTFHLNTKTDLTLLAHYQRIDGGFLNQYLPAQGTLTEAPFGRIPTSLFIGQPGDGFTRVEWAVGYQFLSHLTDYLSVRQNLRFTRIDYKQKQTLGAGIEPGTTLLDRFYLGADSWQNNLAVDSAAIYSHPIGSVASKATLGVDYLNAHDGWFEVDGSAQSLDIRHPVYNGTSQFEDIFQSNDLLQQVGLYAQEQASWRHWHLTAGLRQDWAETRTWDNFDTRVAPINHKLTGRVGLLYLFDNGLAPYASYSTSYQPSIGLDAQGAPLKPLTGEQYEAGIKYQPHGMDSFMTASAYQVTEHNVSTVNPYNPSSVVQTGAIRVRGVELSGVADFGFGLKLTGSYTYMDGVINRAVPFAIGEATYTIQGNRAPNVPKNSGNLWLDETLPQGRLKGLGGGIGVRYVDAREADRLNTVDLHAYTLADLTIHYSYRQWRTALNIQNLLDHRYVASCYDNGLGSVNDCFYGLRRTIFGNIAYRW
ncbi:TonB-dependent siderophore receptor [Asaia sp. As-1742]|uniref:TonB-dependent siderophore receptor n=1 Tax=Asaia sp. As-1742 TaxID=2608325 RepID=UPI0014204616|nr:TonB-dependent siderophore receptor [Asaia sp. As-1742]